MGYEAQKTNRLRGEAFLRTYFSGSVLDIGCGPDLVVPTARAFDLEHGDANRITDYFPAGSFDCVHSSHCLEHMRDIPSALAGWWSLVRPGGHMVIVVPDEDLYEQGYWPSVFNTDHKASFRLDRKHSWSPVSYEIRHLAGGLAGAEIVAAERQDSAYDHAQLRLPGALGILRGRFLLWFARRRRSAAYHLGLDWPDFDRRCDRVERLLGKPHDQTGSGALAQIQLILRKQP